MAKLKAALNIGQSKIGVAAISLIFTYLFFFEYLPPFAHVYIPYDLVGYHYSLMEYAFQLLRHGSFPLWDPTIYCGIGLASNIQAELFYPPAWLFYAVNRHREQLSYTSLEILVLAHVWLAFLLCYAWLRARQLKPFACVLGAGIFAFSGYMCLQLQHLGLVAGYAWFPLGFMGIDEISRQKSWTPLWKVAAASALCLLAGYPPTWFVLVVCLLTYSLASFGGLKTVICTLAGLGVSLALCAVQLLPTAEASAFMVREGVYGTGIKEGAFYLSYFLPNYFNFGLHVPILTNFGQEYLYLGAPAVFGAVWLMIALAVKRVHGRGVVPFFAVGIVGALVMTNPYDIVWAILKRSSFLADICRAGNFLAVVPLAVAPLAAYGINNFLEYSADSVHRYFRIAIAAAMAAWATWELRFWFTGGDFPHGMNSIYAPTITLLIFGAAVYAVRSQTGSWKTVLIGLVLISVAIDYKAFGTSKRFNAGIGSGQPPFMMSHFPEIEPEVYADLMAHPEYRILLEGGLHPLQLRQVGLTTPQGFDPFLTEQYRKLLEGNAVFTTNRLFDIDPERKDVLRLLGIGYVITAEAHPVYKVLRQDPDFRILGSGTSYYRVFEYRDAVPTLGWEHPTVQDETKPVRWTPRARAIDAYSASGGTVVFKEQFLPGWGASIDGHASIMRRWNGAFSEVTVPAGRHRVEFYFSSRTLVIGAVISMITLIAMIVSVVAAKRRAQ